jgi:hypothetical protein
VLRMEWWEWDQLWDAHLEGGGAVELATLQEAQFQGRVPMLAVEWLIFLLPERVSCSSWVRAKAPFQMIVFLLAMKWLKPFQEEGFVAGDGRCG